MNYTITEIATIVKAQKRAYKDYTITALLTDSRSLTFPESKEIASQWYKIQRALEHRPLMPDKDEYTIFLQHTLDKVMRFQQMYPYINVSNEITELNTRISQI